MVPRMDVCVKYGGAGNVYPCPKRHKVRGFFLALLLLGSLAVLRSINTGGSDYSSSSHIEGTNDTSIHASISNFSSTLVEDDPACLSRTQESLLRRRARQGLIDMPAPLLKKWKRYKKLHRRCVNGVDMLRSVTDDRENYGSNNDQERRLSADDIQGCRYVVFLENQMDGLGNRFMGLVSAMAYALATERVMLIDNSRQLGELLCEPVEGSSWLLPEGVLTPGRLMGLAEFLRGEWEGASATGRGGQSGGGSGAALGLGKMVKLSAWDEPGEGDLEMFCEEAHERLTRVRWVAWESDLYTVPNLFLIPSFWQATRPLLDPPDRSFALISRLILLPSNPVWSAIRREHVSFTAGATLLKGVQIRLHGQPDPAGFDAASYSAIMDCIANTTSFLPHAAAGLRATQPGTSDERRVAGQESDVAVLVASLQGRYFEEMKRHVPASVARIHSPSALGRQDFSLQQAQQAMAEMWLLSCADELATSASSTFGYVAQAWGGTRPLVLELSGAPARRAAHCRFGYSSEPCSHLPRTPLCLRSPADLDRMLSASHRRWISAHLRVCQDRPDAAWQLVSRSTPLQTAPSVVV